MMSTVLITGGTGLIGTALTKKLIEKGYEVIIITRRRRDEGYEMRGKVYYAEWDVEEQTIDADAIKKADYIIHLAGANVGEKRWTKKRKKEIVDSRIRSSQLLVKALREIPNKIKAIVSASAIGWYLTPSPSPASRRGEQQRAFIETDPPAKDFLGGACEKWEAAMQPVKESGKRLVILRTGIVLSNDGGAYKQLEKPLKFGVATILGTGKQTISWIHIDDIVNLYITAIENGNLNGVYNAVAPNPVSNKELIIKMAKQRKKFYVPVHVPVFALKMILGEMSIEVLKSATVSSEKIQSEGYRFLFSTIESAVKELES